MTVKYGTFELPTNIKIEEATKTDTFIRFIAEAFERGFGHTVGNALRRIMLTALEAPALISVKIEGFPHEYTAVEGIIEDMTHIVLNFKGVLFSSFFFPWYPYLKTDCTSFFVLFSIKGQNTIA